VSAGPVDPPGASGSASNRRRAAWAGESASIAIGAVGIAVCTALVASLIAPTNFGGYDEWLILSLVRSGLVSIPFAGRPLELLFDLPAAQLFPDDLRGFLAVHVAYLALCGVLVFLLLRRLAPRPPGLAVLAGLLTALWAPSDFLRLNAVETVAYSGTALCALAAITLFVFAWVRRQPLLLLLAVLVGAVAGRCYESALGLLAAAPLFVPGRLREQPPPFSRWVLAWESAVAIHAVYAAWLLLLGGGSGPALPTYQSQALGPDLHPGRVLQRLADQFLYQLAPLASRSPLESPSLPMALAVAAAAVVLLLHGRPGGDRDESPSVSTAELLLRALATAVLGYSFFVVSGAVRTPARTQFLSAPGIAWLLAGLVAWIAARLPVRWRSPGVVLLACWLVAVAAGRTRAMQEEWHAASYWPAQRACLASLQGLVPGVLPGTAFVLLDETGAWPASFTFHHAIRYLYGHQAAGWVPGAHAMLYDARLGPKGLALVPWPVIREPWRERPAEYAYPSLVLLRQRAEGDVEILDEWPEAQLGPLPAGAAYEPRRRILADGPASPSARILRDYSVRAEPVAAPIRSSTNVFHSWQWGQRQSMSSAR